MLKKTMTYVDYNGEEQTETMYFNLSKAELLELELRHEGGFQHYIDSIIEAKDRNALVDTFRDIIKLSYGKKDPSGKKFIKSEDLSNDFMQSKVYSELFVELLSDSNAAAEFVNGLVPQIGPDGSSKETSVKTM